MRNLRLMVWLLGLSCTLVYGCQSAPSSESPSAISAVQATTPAPTDAPAAPAGGGDSNSPDPNASPDPGRIALKNQVKMMGLAINQYAMDYDDLLPPSESLQAGIKPYIRGSSKNLDAMLEPWTSTVTGVKSGPFEYVSPGALTASDPKAKTTKIGSKKGYGITVVLYADGHTDTVEGE